MNMGGIFFHARCQVALGNAFTGGELSSLCMRSQVQPGNEKKPTSKKRLAYVRHNEWRLSEIESSRLNLMMNTIILRCNLAI